jgi:hypothetical protein
MKVDSPVGRFPYAPERLRLKRTGLLIEGHMGAWPARVEVEPSDLLTLTRVLARPLLAAAGAGMVVVALQRLRRGRSS